MFAAAGNHSSSLQFPALCAFDCLNLTPAILPPIDLDISFWLRCNIAQLGLDKLLLLLLSRTSDIEDWAIPMDTVCWTLSYSLSVSLRHISHTVLVFGVQPDVSACYALGKT